VTDAEFDRMVIDFGRDIYRFCKVETGDTTLGDELYQETMLTLWERRKRLDVNNNIKNYALGAAIRIWKNQKRKYARRMRLVPQDSLEGYQEKGKEFSSLESVSEDDNPETRFLRSESGEEVRQAVNALPDKYREVIHLYYAAELKPEEIAKTLGIPKGTVRSRLRKAKELLKVRMEAIGYDG